MTLIFQNSFSINGSEGGGGSTGLKPPYSYSITPALRNLNSSYPFKYMNNAVGYFASYRERCYWSINYNGNNDIAPSSSNDLQNIELQCKFIITDQASYMQELFSLGGVFTPDIETNNKLGFWDSANQQYWLEQPFNINTWYWLKFYYDVATYTQTWYLSTDGTNFTTIGTHAEDRNSEFLHNWDTSTATNSALFFGSINPGGTGSSLSDYRTLTTGYIDMNETWIKTNGILRCSGKIQGN